MILSKLWPWGRRKKNPILLENEAVFSDFDQDRPIETYEFVSFDTELTGLNPKRDRIISIGAVRIRNLRIVAGDNFFAYIKPDRDLPKESTLIHGITPEQLELAPPPEIMLPQFVKYCGKALLVGHYVELDMAFLNRACKRALGGSVKNPCVDSMRLAQAFQEYQRKSHLGFDPEVAYNLRNLAREYNLPLFMQHDALEDALQTAYLFLFLVKSMLSAGFVTLREFNNADRTGPNVCA
jgi:DNA polymerase III subunit epsilon